MVSVYTDADYLSAHKQKQQPPRDQVILRRLLFRKEREKEKKDFLHF